jgi:uncharacterized membrane protein YphA (DoxX/SURF4 family)
MTDEKKHPLFIMFHIARFFLGGVFIYASYDKIINPDDFARIVFNYQILPHNLVNLAAIILPWIELIVGLCLIIGWWIPGAVVIVTALLIVFISASLFNLARGLDVHCGCFSAGVLETTSARLSILRDTFFLAVSFFLIYMVFWVKKKSGFQSVEFRG